MFINLLAFVDQGDVDPIFTRIGEIDIGVEGPVGVGARFLIENTGSFRLLRDFKFYGHVTKRLAFVIENNRRLAKLRNGVAILRCSRELWLISRKMHKM